MCVQRSTQVPAEQYWPFVQVTPEQGSLTQAPPMQAWPFAHASPGEVQSTQTPALQWAGAVHATPVQRSTQSPVSLSHFLSDEHVTPMQRCGMQNVPSHM